MGKANHEYADYLADVLTPLGPIHWRAMFGGYGFYCGELFFALAVDDVLYLKADADTRPRFEAEGLPPFRRKIRARAPASAIFRRRTTFLMMTRPCGSGVIWRWARPCGRARRASPPPKSRQAPRQAQRSQNRWQIDYRICWCRPMAAQTLKSSR